MKRARQSGFTLIEVMFALALLGLALVVLIKSAAGSVFNAEQAHMLGIATDLGRGEMNEIEETLLKDGFQDTDQTQDWKGFDELGWPNIKYSYKVEVAEMPTFDQLTAMANGSAGSNAAAGSGSALHSVYGTGSGFGSGSDFSLSNGAVDPLATFQNSTLGGMMGMMGGLSGGSDIAGAGAGALIQSQYSMFQEILKDSVRKVTLKLKWQVLGSDRDLTFVAFYTDASAMDRTLNGLGANDTSGTGSGSSSTGSGTGSGRGSGSGSGTRRTP